MKIVLARIDDRLIHGQIVTRLLKELDVNRIIIVNNDIFYDNIRKSIILNTSPNNIITNIVNLDKMLLVYNNIKYSKDRVILIFTNPSDVLYLLKKNFKLKVLNIGGMSYKDNKIKLTNFIYVDKNDIKSLIEIDKLGVNLDARMVMSDNKIDLISIINKLNK